MGGVGLVWTVLVLGASCTAHGMGDRTSEPCVKIKAILEDPSGFSGKGVRLEEVRFKGWAGGCRGAPPVSRSDWMVEDETGCIYVHGPLPKGLAPMSPADERISLEGQVDIGSNGMPYLRIVSP